MWFPAPCLIETIITRKCVNACASVLAGVCREVRSEQLKCLLCLGKEVTVSDLSEFCIFRVLFYGYNTHSFSGTYCQWEAGV